MHFQARNREKEQIQRQASNRQGTADVFSGRKTKSKVRMMFCEVKMERCC